MTAKVFPGALSSPQGMRLAVSAAESAGPKAPILFRGDLGECVRGAKAMGYAGMEVHVGDIWNFDAGLLQRQCRDADFAISALVTGQLNVRQGYSLCHDDPANVAKAIEGLCRFIEAAQVLSTGMVIGWVRGKVGDQRERRLDMQAEGLRQVAVQAQAAGVPLYIECINRYELDTLNNARETVDFIRHYDLPSTYVHLDTFHMNIEEASPIEAIDTAGPLLGYFHLAENTRWYPGHDYYDFVAVLDYLRNRGYAGFVDVECLPFPTPREAAALAFEFLQYMF